MIVILSNEDDGPRSRLVARRQGQPTMVVSGLEKDSDVLWSMMRMTDFFIGSRSSST
jgi:hypothetical protein